MPPPHSKPDGHAALRAALQRDAARVSASPFDAALHAATLRRIRALPAAGALLAGWRWPRVLAASVALGLLLGGVASHRHPRTARSVAAQTGGRVSAVGAPAPRSSLLAYRQAAAQGDEALSAMLDRDAATLLPPSAPVFPHRPASVNLLAP